MGIRDMWARWTRREPVGIMPAVDTEEPEQPRELWTVPHMAEWLGISPQALNERITRGTVRPHYWARWGNRTIYMFDPARVKHWRKTHA